MKKKKKGFKVEKKWIYVVVIIALIQFFSYYNNGIERFYSRGFYPLFSPILRFLFGWVPFSFGDVLYTIAACWVLYQLGKNLFLWFRKKIARQIFFKNLGNGLWWLLCLYIIFSVFWGLNYNREGIASQLQLGDLNYDTAEVNQVQSILIKQINTSRIKIQSQHLKYPSNKELFKIAKNSYETIRKTYPFLNYNVTSVKSSMYGWLGNYINIGGYYNPFTGEAQINTTGPPFIEPFTITHEIAHQLGYAKENEANFVGYLAAANSDNELFRYAAYLNLYFYTNNELYSFDSVASQQSIQLLIPEVRSDIKQLQEFNLAHQSFLEPISTWIYSKYLKFNQQPAGMRSYNEVVAMLIAYYKKSGKL